MPTVHFQRILKVNSYLIKWKLNIIFYIYIEFLSEPTDLTEVGALFLLGGEGRIPIFSLATSKVKAPTMLVLRIHTFAIMIFMVKTPPPES